MSIWKELTDKSWETPGYVGAINDRSRGPGPAAKTGLAMFLAVLTSMFCLFVVGYRVRMQEADWVSITDPQILWVNTALLILASVLMQRARAAAIAGRIAPVRNNLTLAGIFTIAFLVGQYLAWQELRAAGVYGVFSAAATFFVLLTALHAIHLVGGLLVWSRASWRAWQGMEVKRLRLSVELCTTYWHYLLLVWFVFFTLLLST
jgi:cytochrome c oxidase subunit 3